VESSGHAGRECAAPDKWSSFKRLERLTSSRKMHLLFTPRVLFFRREWSKVRNVNGRGYRSLTSIDERKIRGASMYGPMQAQAKTDPQISRSGALARIDFSNASKAEVRAYLSELKTLPRSQRRLLCKLLRRAAANAPGKVSVVRLADPTQT
jgi:hypothetical protein